MKLSTKYRSIPHLVGSKKLDAKDVSMDLAQSEHFTKKCLHNAYVVVELKYDGTNVGVKRVGDELLAYQRHGYPCESSKWPFHHDFNDWVQSTRVKKGLLHLLKDGYSLRGEWLRGTKGIHYKFKKFQPPFVAFDLYDSNGRVRGAERSEFLRGLEHHVGVIRNRPLHIGPAINPLSITKEMREWSEPIKPIEQEHEGYVYRIYNSNDEFVRIAKWVRPDFETLSNR